MRISQSGIRAARILTEIVSNNLANATNPDYTRQQGRLTSADTIWDGRHFFGQGVEVREIVRIRDELLDEQVRNTQSSSAKYKVISDWLHRVESTYNEPSEYGVSQALNDFWGSWQTLSQDPRSLAARSGAISSAENLAQKINALHTRLDDLHTQVVSDLQTRVASINSLTSEIADLNNQIFELEVGRNGKANDLRDARDGALDRLAEIVDISYFEGANGMVNVTISGHPTVIENKSEELDIRPSLADTSQLQLVWEYGEYYRNSENGALAGVLEVRDNYIPAYQAELDSFANLLITEVNKIYAQGVALEGQTLIESQLGYEALGVSAANDTLSLLSSGEYRSIFISFYDDDGKIIRSHGIVVDSDDSLQDIADKLNGITGLNASLISSTDADGKLHLELDTTSGDNALGEVSFAISNNTGGHDTGSLLRTLGFDQTAKSTNTSAAAPVLSSMDLSLLQDINQWNEKSLADVQAHVMGIAGRFTINLYETFTETAGKTDGRLMQQLTIEYDVNDTPTSIRNKINALTADFGVSASFVGNELQITSTAQTDSNGEFVLAGGTDYLRMSFSNEYRYPVETDDTPPDGYTGTGDELGLLYRIQMNTLYSGDSASTIALDETVSTPEKLNAAYLLADGDNRLALALAELDQLRVADSARFSVSEHYANVVASVGTDVRHQDQLAQHEALLLQSFVNERASISGVNVDEELGQMLAYQRSYEANARMFATLNQMVEEILRLT